VITLTWGYKYDEFESMFDPSIKQAATATIDYNKERRSGKQCDRIAHIERVHPLNTSERVFPTHRVFDIHHASTPTPPSTMARTKHVHVQVTMICVCM
jgi:hypothetical protein